MARERYSKHSLIKVVVRKILLVFPLLFLLALVFGEFGKGFGAHAEDYPRGKRAPYSYEVLAPILLMKLGIVSYILWIVHLLYVVVDALRTARATENSAVHASPSWDFSLLRWPYRRTLCC